MKYIFLRNRKYCLRNIIDVKLKFFSFLLLLVKRESRVGEVREKYGKREIMRNGKIFRRESVW